MIAFLHKLYKEVFPTKPIGQNSPGGSVSRRALLQPNGLSEEKRNQRIAQYQKLLKKEGEQNGFYYHN